QEDRCKGRRKDGARRQLSSWRRTLSDKAVLVLLLNNPQAEGIVESLRRGGFNNDDISVLFPDKTGTRDFAHEQNTKAPEGAIAGVSAGGAVGGTLGLLAGIGALGI